MPYSSPQGHHAKSSQRSVKSPAVLMLRLKKKGELSLRPLLSLFLVFAVVAGSNLLPFSPLSDPAQAATVGSGYCEQTVGNSTGVTVVTSGSNCIVSFTSVGTTTWAVPAGVSNVSYLVVGGGASGARGWCGYYWGGGGGGGGVTTGTLNPTGTVSVTVGSGGTGPTTSACSTQTGQNGTASSLGTISATGGQRAVFNTPWGGTSGSPSTAGSTQGNTGGNAGGTGASGCTDAFKCGAGGGGGAGGQGSGLNGGAGITSSISGSSVMYGAGGAGRNSDTFGTAFSGGGTSASPNGSRPGAGGYDMGSYAGNGANGIVILSYNFYVNQANLAISTTTATRPQSTSQLATTGGSGTGAVTYQVTNAGTANCSVSGSTLSFTTAGTCSLTATKAASLNFNATTSAVTTFTVLLANMGNVSTPIVSATTGQLKSIEVSWASVNNADRYRVKLYNSDGSILRGIVTVNNVTTYTLTTADYSLLADNTEYKVTVAALSSTGNFAEGNESSQVSVVTNRSFTVSYLYANATSGNLVTSESFITTGTALTLPTPLKTGYTFDGWYDASTGGTKIGNAGASFTPTSSLTLHARWVADTYTVTYNYNGATGANTGTSDSFTVGGTAISLPVPTRTGYTFGGWYEASNLSGSALGSTYSPSSSRTIYAKWTANSNTVTFSNGGGTGSMSNQSITTGSATALSSNTFTRTGYTFAGWATSQGGSVVYSDGQLVTITGGLSLVAVWSAGTNTVTFNAGGGTGSMSNQSITTDVATTLTSNSFTRTGYTFAGWATTLNGSLAFANNASVTLTSGLTLFARWTANSNTVTFSSGGGSGSMSNQVITTDVSTALSSNTFTRTGYDFTGWATSQGGPVVYSNGQSVTITGGLNLVAVWGPQTNVVTFNANDGSGSPATSTQNIVSGASTALTANGFTRTGYTFAGWNTAALGTGTAYTNSQAITIVAPLTLFAQWTPNVYTVTYSANGGTGSPSKTTDTFTVGTTGLTLPTQGSLVRTGFTFGGWSESQNGTALSGPYSPTATRTLHAVWTAATYNITYNTNSATAGSPSVTSGTFTTGGTPITLATQSTMVRDGYTFEGWSTTRNDASTKITTSGSYTITSSVILFALWDAIDYTVTYSTQDSTGGTAPTDATNYNIGDDAVIKANTGNLVRTGYSFAGWTVNSNGTGTVYQSGSTYEFATQSITLYPKWTANTYTITYNTNGATGAPSRTSDSYTTGTSGLSLPNVGTMVRTGYNFQGWSPSPSGSELNNNGYTTTTNVMLYAVWTLKTINYSYLRGTVDSTSLSSNNMTQFPDPALSSGLFGSTIQLPEIGTDPTDISGTATLSGNTYRFMGWTDGSSNYGPGDTFTLRATDVSFTAIWLRLYQVRYVLNGGSGLLAVDDECDTQPGDMCEAGDVIGLHQAPTRAGYTFTGWKNQSGQSFTASQQNVALTPTSFIFYAQWEAIDFTMSFDVLGGSATVSPLTKNIGESFAMPNPGTKTGYTFSGWSDGTVTLGVGANFIVGSSSKAFTAVWTPNTYVVSYNWTGGSGTPVPEASYTYGTAGITLPTGSSHTRDGFVFDGWATTPNGASVGNTFIPTQNTLLYARWIDGAYAMNLNTRGGTLNQTVYSISRGSNMVLPLPTREGFVFEGWYEDSATTTYVGAANAVITPSVSRTLHAKWVQNSLAGINPAHINSLATINIAGAHTWTGSHTQSGTGAALDVPSGALPTGTELKVSFVEDHSRSRDLISQSYAYYTSVVVHWLTGSGDSATVPPTAANKPISLTLTNPSILPGAKVFMILAGVATQVAVATQAGSVTILITEDPEFVVAATPPVLPASLSATQVNQNRATVSWTAPSSNGGSPITGYTVTASPGGGTCSTTTELTCDITGLSSGVTYSYSVIAMNAIGNSSARQATVTYVPAPVANPAPQPPSSDSTPSENSSTPAANDFTSSRGLTVFSVPETPQSAGIVSAPQETAPQETAPQAPEVSPEENQTQPEVADEPVSWGLLWVIAILALLATVLAIVIQRRLKH